MPTRLTSELATESESVRDLKSEDFSAKFEAEDSEPLKFTARPPTSEPATESVPVRDLKSEDFSTRLEKEVSVPVRL